MAASGRRRWLVGIGLITVIFAILAFLYVQGQRRDQASYYENAGRLHQMEGLDARWEVNALKSRIGINPDYDPLVDPLTTLGELLAQLKAAATSATTTSPALTQEVDALDQAIGEKVRLVEKFKSHNAVLRNSLAFLPDAAKDLQQAAQAASGLAAARRRLVAGSDQILLASLVYSRDGSAERAVQIEAALADLTAGNQQLPAAPGESLDIFAAHVRTVLREQQTVNVLIHQIGAAPVERRIEAIGDLLAGEQQQAAINDARIHQYLLAFTVLLAALLAYAAYGLIRSYAVIQEVNRQLQQANESLEQRVQQRSLELQAAQAELVNTARLAGMAEIATNVLHNVGNVLNSVNVSAGQIGSQVRASKVAGLARAVQMLDEHAADLGDFLTRDDKGKRLPEYLAKLAETLIFEQANILEELGQLTKRVDHIKDIVATQQTYAGSSRLVESVQVRDLVDDALRMHAASLMRHEVCVIKEIAEIPVLRLDRHRVLQILVNLISNAKQAMNAMAATKGIANRPHRITLRVNVADGAAGRSLQICVADEGDGISTENLTRIFNHGFTTRKNGHGFGLHSCILAAREMGGTLTAHSDGPGQGAAFTLELPIVAEVTEGIAA